MTGAGEVASLAPPAASVVMVSYRGVSWTERAVDALARHTPEPVEVIVVDNGSGPGVEERLRALPGVRLVANGRNLGFGVASNQGAALARARVVVFLNNDALVTAGWLPPLLERLEDPAVGAVGPTVLNLDGTVQAVGESVWRDGVTTAFGLGRPAGSPDVSFRRTVDYVLGACIAVRRDAFNRVGGVDPVYWPAYYEDVDLCFALAAHGLRTEHEPRSVVVHAGGASGATERALEMVRRHRPIFRERWRHALAGRPLLPPLPLTAPQEVHGRDLPATHRILVAVDALPPDGDPALAALAAGWPSARITALVDGPADALAVATLRAAGVEVGERDVAESWIRDRDGHYEVVVLAGAGAADRLGAPLARHQSRAALVVLPDACDVDALVAAPAGARRDGLGRLARRLARAEAVVVRAGGDGSRTRAFVPDGAAVVEEGGAGPPALHRALAAVGVPPPVV